MKRRYIEVVIAGVIFLLALLLTLYPILSNLYNQHHQSEIYTAYEEVIQQADSSDLERMREQAEAYNTAIVPGTSETSYSQTALLAASENYESQLNPSGNGIMGYIDIPKIGVNLPVYHGTDAETLDQGAGHLLGSSLPVGGESTHAIITGHSGLASQKMLTDLEQLEVGDVFYIHVLEQTLAYQVFRKDAVLPHDTSLLGITQGEDYCTLVTCYPTGVNTHRLLVQGTRIPYEEAETIAEITAMEEKQVSQWESQYMLGVWLGIAGMLTVGLLYFLVRTCRHRYKRQKGDCNEEPPDL